MKYLIDSNLCIAIMNGRAQQVEASLDIARKAGGELYLPTMALHELWSGVAKSQQKQANSAKLLDFLLEPIAALEFTMEDAQASGDIHATLAQRGTPIGPYGVLIAGQALARGMTLVTANTREFGRVDDLKLVNWTL